MFITHDLDEALKIADHLVILKDGEIIQQGEPQDILLHPADPYIEDFVGDINRARVLRVRSVMTKDAGEGSAPEIDADATLEQAILLADGQADVVLSVIQDGRLVGVLRMTDVLKALVPRVPGGL